MTEPLRPMSTGQVLDHTFTLYRKNFILFVGIACVGPAAYLIFQLLMVGSAVTPVASHRAATAGLSFAFGVMAGLIVMLAGMAIAHAATVKAVAAVYLGRKISIAGAYRALSGRILRVLGVFALMMLISGVAAGIIILVAVLVGTVAVVGGAKAGTAGTVVGIIVGFGAAVVGGLVAIAVYIRYSLAVQACVVEDLGVIASLKRSAVLSKGSRSRILTVYFVFGVLSYILAFGLGAIAAAGGAVLHNPILAMILIYVATFIAGALNGPLATIGISLLYYDERVRKEAFDLQLMMSSLDAAGVPGATQYIEQLQNYENQIAEIASAPQKAVDLRDSIPETLTVHTARGDVPADLSFLRDALNRYLTATAQVKPTILANAGSRLKAMRAEAEVYEQPGHADGATRKRLDQILSAREFDRVRGPTALDLLKERIQAWIGRLLRKIDPKIPDIADLGQWFVWGMIALAAAIAGVWLYRVSQQGMSGHREIIPFMPSSRSWREWLVSQFDSWFQFVEGTFCGTDPQVRGELVWNPSDHRSGLHSVLYSP